jgi:hypothetical protein
MGVGRLKTLRRVAVIQCFFGIARCCNRRRIRDQSDWGDSAMRTGRRGCFVTSEPTFSTTSGMRTRSQQPPRSRQSGCEAWQHFCTARKSSKHPIYKCLDRDSVDRDSVGLGQKSWNLKKCDALEIHLAADARY